MAASYAGYLVLEDEAIAEAADLTALVREYRTKEIKSIHASIIGPIGEERFTWETPIVLSDSDDMLRLKGLKLPMFTTNPDLPGTRDT